MINTCNEMSLFLKSTMVNRLMGLKVQHDGFKPTKSLEWWSVVSFVR